VKNILHLDVRATMRTLQQFLVAFMP